LASTLIQPSYLALKICVQAEQAWLYGAEVQFGNKFKVLAAAYSQERTQLFHSKSSVVRAMQIVPVMLAMNRIRAAGSSAVKRRSDATRKKITRIL